MLIAPRPAKEHSLSEGPPIRIIAPDGTADERAVRDLDLKDEDLRELYRLLALTRRADLEATALQRQGELAVYPPLIGQEAAQVGSAYALGEADFIFPSYRELGAALVRRIDLVDYLAFYRATWHGGTYDMYEHRFGHVSVPVGSQPLHAVGYALGKKMDGERMCALTYFGDGATSEGDVHEAMNFAAVNRLAIVFVCENNLYAYSTPFEKAFAIPEVSVRAQAYGFPGVDVYGNDLLRVHRAAQEAITRARRGQGPTLLECKTFRWHGHSEHDRASYRTQEELIEWRARDPILQFERYLEEKGLVDEAGRREVTARVEQKIDEAVAFAEASPWPEGPEALEHIYAD
jgi:2-oxoisovalerate dehydrogenase E1 component subunit alpha